MRQLLPRLPGRDRPAGNASRGHELLRAGRLQFNRLTLNVGVRAERWEHFATTGDNIYTFPWEFGAAPERGLRHHRRRHAEGVGVLGPLLRPDPHGHDQLRRHAHRLDRRRAGLHQHSTSGSPTARAAARRCRTGSSRRRPRRRTPTNSQFGYEVDLGHNMSFDAQLLQPPHAATSSRTSTRALRAIRAQLPGPDINDPNSLFLGCDYFGFDRRTRGSELLPRHARRRQAQLQRPRVGVPQALRRQLAGCWRRTTTWTRRATPSPTERRLPGRRALARSARAEPVRHAARH